MNDAHQPRAVVSGLTSADIDLLHDSLREAEKRAALLSELIEALNLSRDGITLLQRSVESVVRAIAASGAFVYLWDDDSGRFVLRAATEGHQKAFIGRISLRSGEGLTGWSALMRRSVLIGEGLDRDPRIMVFPELHEGEFRSCMVVPILVPGGDPVGVFSIYSLENSAFTESDLRLVDEVAKLLASGIDRANVVYQWERHSAALESLFGVAAAAPRDVRMCLVELAQDSMAIVTSEICTVESIDFDRSTSDAVALTSRHDSTEAEQDLAGFNVMSLQAAKQLVKSAFPPLQTATATMRVGERTVGVITLFRLAPYSPQDRSLLAAVAGYGALALQTVIARGSTESVLGQLISARSERAAIDILKKLGWTTGSSVVPFVLRCDTDLALPNLRSLDSVAHTVETVFSGKNRRVIPAYPGVVGALLFGSIESDDLHELAKGIAKQVAVALEDKGQVARTAIGVGKRATTPLEVVAQLRAAADASAWIAVTSEGISVGIAGDEDLDRQLLNVVRKVSPSVGQHIVSLSRVKDHDAKHGTDLLETMDVFVRERGSLQQASERLFIHRNTLRQRLNRIASLIDQPIEEVENWLSVSLAILVLRSTH